MIEHFCIPKRDQFFQGLTGKCLEVNAFHPKTIVIFLFSGDHLGVYPHNDPALVQKIGDMVGVNLDVVFTLTNTDG